MAYLLRDTKVFGFPNEWLSFPHMSDELDDLAANDISTYLRRVLAKHSSPNGVSGIEIALSQIQSARCLGDVDQVLDTSMRYFYLRRRNIVRQGLSLHVALQSGVLHSFQLDDHARSVRESVVYNSHAIRQHIKWLHDQELMWEREFSSRHIEPDRIYYEDLIERPERILRRFANVLGLPETPLMPPQASIEDLGHSRRDEWEARYREEDADYLEALKLHRPKVHIPLSMT